MRAAYALAREALPRYSGKFSRHDFTRPRLFACLVLREHQKKSYRGVEALLRDFRNGWTTSACRACRITTRRAGRST